MACQIKELAEYILANHDETSSVWKQVNAVIKKGKTSTETSNTNIYYGTGENAELSNLAVRPFILKGREFQSVEHAYQSLKSGSLEDKIYSKDWSKGGLVARGTKGTKTDNNWNIEVLMKKLLVESFKQNPEAWDALLATKGQTLTHTQGDKVWQEAFPRLLMEIRDGKTVPRSKGPSLEIKPTTETAQEQTESQVGIAKDMTKTLNYKDIEELLETYGNARETVIGDEVGYVGEHDTKYTINYKNKIRIMDGEVWDAIGLDGNDLRVLNRAIQLLNEGKAHKQLSKPQQRVLKIMTDLTHEQLAEIIENSEYAAGASLGYSNIQNQKVGADINGKFDKKLAKKIEAILRKLYPEIKLEYTEQEILHGEGVMNQEVGHNPNEIADVAALMRELGYNTNGAVARDVTNIEILDAQIKILDELSRKGNANLDTILDWIDTSEHTDPAKRGNRGRDHAIKYGTGTYKYTGEDGQKPPTDAEQSRHLIMQVAEELVEVIEEKGNVSSKVSKMLEQQKRAFKSLRFLGSTVNKDTGLTNDEQLKNELKGSKYAGLDVMSNVDKYQLIITIANDIKLEIESEVVLQKQEGRIKGQADIKAKTVLINSLLQSQDTLPHEYAHHYIAWFRDAPIVQEAIKKWGSEEQLVQAIGEQVVKQRGEVYDWWKKFSQWIQGKFNKLSDKSKEELRNILTDAFLTKQNLYSFVRTNAEKDKAKVEEAAVNKLIKSKAKVDIIQPSEVFTKNINKLMKC